MDPPVLWSDDRRLGDFPTRHLLLFFVYPFWGKLKSYPWAVKAQRGVNAVAGGLVAGVLVQILMNMSWIGENAVAFVLTLGLLMGRKVPAPYIVAVVGLIYGATQTFK